MSDPKITFAPLPARSIGDQRLSGLHFRVLAAICLHDRMSAKRGKGQGCWAGNKTLAAECGCEYSRLSATITDLGKWGYVEREVHPVNKRLRIYRVTYTDDDLAAIKASNSLPTGKQSPAGADQTVCQPANDAPQTVCRQNPQASDSIEEPQHNILRETGKILGETSERYSPEGAPLGSGASSNGREPNIGGQLARFERLAKSRQLRKAELRAWHEWLWALQDSMDRDDPNYGRTLRLLENTEWPAGVGT